MGTIEKQLSGALEDTQESLATALARVEALRIREKHLLQENARLRVKLREAGVPETGSVSPRSQPSNSPRSVVSAGGGEEAVDGFAPDSAGASQALSTVAQQHPVILHTSSSKEVFASVATTQDTLEFYERRARISASEFVGMSAVDGSAKSSGKSSWMSYLFGKSSSKAKYKESKPDQPPFPIQNSSQDVPLGPIPGTPPPERAGRTMDTLERRSWGGEKGDWTGDGNGPEPGHDSQRSGLWQVLWKDGGGNGKLRRIIFEAGVATQAFVHQHIESWSRGAQANPRPTQADQGMSNAQSSSPPEEPSPATQQGSQGELVPPKHFIPDGVTPNLDHKSDLLTEDHLKCLTAAIPRRYKQASWSLLYSTTKHGISLHTLYRRAANIAPSILVVKDTSDYVFGAYVSEAWKIAPRFYGTGETFVFQIEPHRIYYPWKKESKVRNDFFMYGSMESLGVGGTGHFAVWLDGELEYGHSGMCDTFGSPCLAGENEFKIMAVELWGLS